MVEDTGIGIPPDKQRLIFEAFQQADAGTSRQYGGTGLGLTISRELTALLGGEIRLVSVPGQGSTFTLYLPLRYMGAGPRSSPRASFPRSGYLGLPHPGAHQRPGSVPAAAAAPREAAGSPDLRGRKVLIVDDDARNVFALTAFFENQGMEVVTATNGRKAIEIVGATPDLSVVLMDIMMPDMDGYEAIHTIRTDPRFLRLPIIAVTASAQDSAKCFEAGASDYTTKPVNTDHLLLSMRRLVR